MQGLQPKKIIDISNPMWRRGQVPPPWPCESWKATKGSHESETVECGRGPAGLGPVLLSGGGGAHRRARDCLTVVEVWSCAPDGCFVPGRTGRLTVGRNMRLGSASLCLRGN
jgi:hypothetical protein